MSVYVPSLAWSALRGNAYGLGSSASGGTSASLSADCGLPVPFLMLFSYSSWSGTAPSSPERGGGVRGVPRVLLVANTAPPLMKFYFYHEIIDRKMNLTIAFRCRMKYLNSKKKINKKGNKQKSNVWKEFIALLKMQLSTSVLWCWDGQEWGLASNRWWILLNECSGRQADECCWV